MRSVTLAVLRAARLTLSLILSSLSFYGFYLLTHLDDSGFLMETYQTCGVLPPDQFLTETILNVLQTDGL